MVTIMSWNVRPIQHQMAFSQFEILSRISAGAHGEIFQAKDTANDYEVVLKRYHGRRTGAASDRT